MLQRDGLFAMISAAFQRFAAATGTTPPAQQAVDFSERAAPAKRFSVQRPEQLPGYSVVGQLATRQRTQRGHVLDRNLANRALCVRGVDQLLELRTQPVLLIYSCQRRRVGDVHHSADKARQPTISAYLEQSEQVSDRATCFVHVVQEVANATAILSFALWHGFRA